MKIVKVIVFIAAMYALIGCEADRCFKRAGDTVTELHYFDSIGTLNIEGVFEVELVQDSSYYIEVIAPKEVAKGIDFEMKGDSLSCYNYNMCFWRRDFDRPNLRIHFPFIYEIWVYESSYLYSIEEITTNFRLVVATGLAEADLLFNNRDVYFFINKTSGGRYTFKGKTGKTFFMNFNTGLYDMSELISETARVQNYSVIDVSVNVIDNLYVQIHNTGNILYHGNPQIIYDSVSSTGKVIPLDF